MDAIDEAKSSGDKWAVYQVGFEKAAATSGDWIPMEVAAGSKYEFFGLGSGDDSYCSGVNVRFRACISFYPTERLWQLELVITNLDAWLEPEMAEDEFEMPGEDVCESSTYRLAELVTGETDPYKAVQRMMRLYYAVRKGRDWSMLEGDDGTDERHDRVLEAFYDAQDEFLERKR